MILRVSVCLPICFFWPCLKRLNINDFSGTIWSVRGFRPFQQPLKANTGMMTICHRLPIFQDRPINRQPLPTVMDPQKPKRNLLCLKALWRGSLGDQNTVENMDQVAWYSEAKGFMYHEPLCEMFLVLTKSIF